MMIFKSLCLQKPLLKSQDFGTCYAGRGLRSGTPRWGYPSHRYRGGPIPFAKPWAATPLRRPFDFRSSWQLLSWSKRWANAVFSPIWRSTLTYFAVKFLVKTFDFRSFFLHCQKRQFDELGKLANIVTRFFNTEEI